MIIVGQTGLIVSDAHEVYGIRYRVANHWPRKRLRTEFDECLQTMKDPSLGEIQKNVRKRYQRSIRMKINNEPFRTRMDGEAVAALQSRVKKGQC